MTKTKTSMGHFRSGLPYKRAGHGPRPLVALDGLMFENKPMPGPMIPDYTFLGEDYTVYLVNRKPGLPVGYSLRDMADDYATMIREEFGGPVDVIGVSTGGSIALHLAADHGDLLRRLVLHSSAYRLSDSARAIQLHLARLAREGRWREAYAAMTELILPRQGLLHHVARPIAWLAAAMITAFMAAPKDPSDFVVTVEAEDVLDFQRRLGEIAAPTLVAAGELDPFYSVPLFRETAAGIPNAHLILYTGMGHPAAGKQFERDVLSFLRA